MRGWAGGREVPERELGGINALPWCGRGRCLMVIKAQGLMGGTRTAAGRAFTAGQGLVDAAMLLGWLAPAVLALPSARPYTRRIARAQLQLC